MLEGLSCLRVSVFITQLILLTGRKKLTLAGLLVVKLYLNAVCWLREVKAIGSCSSERCFV